MTLFFIILFSILGSIGVIITIGSYLLFKEKIQKILIPFLIAYASGTLLASAFLGLIPEAVERLELRPILLTVLIGIIIFFLIEKTIIWHHCHDQKCEIHKASGQMILIGDAFHNFADGVVIAASFLISIPFGIMVGFSMILHEIPQEVGDFAILIHSGYKKKKALLLNILSSLTTLPAAILSYYILEPVQGVVPYIMAISAASFIYIALSDLVPELHRKHVSANVKNIITQFLLLLTGIITIILLLTFHHH